jgi:serine/threonine-protein kinase
MSYCPECGSEVAQNDVFCAYCGIAIPNIAPQNEVAEPNNEQSAAAESNNGASVELPQNNENLPEPIGVVHNTLEDSIPSVPVVLQEMNVENEKAQAPISGQSIAPPTFTDELIKEERSNINDVLENQETDNSESIPTYKENLEVSPAIDEKPVINNIEENNDENISDSNGDSNQQFINSANLDQPQTADDNLQDKIETTNDLSPKSDEFSTPVSTEPQNVFEQKIPVENELPSAELELPETSTEDDEEEKLKSVLDEIDLNLQNQSNQNVAEEAIEKPNLPIQEEGVVIPTAANLQQEFIPPPTEEAIIQPSASNYAPEIQANIGENFSAPVFEEKQPEVAQTPADYEIPVANEAKPFNSEAEQIVEEEKGDEEFDEPATLLSGDFNFSVPKSTESKVSEPTIESEEQREARSFTNPNIGNADTDNRNKTKLKPLDEGVVLNGRYEIVRKIGGGGMGAVYLATDKNLGGVLRAVKEMVQSYIEDEQQEKAVNDFKRESLLLTSLEHSAIPTIYDYFFDEKEARFYLVMKYISGGDLAARLRSAPEGRIDEVSVTDWAIQVADVLDYLHNRQPPIVYRDLKPSNIMIDGNTGKLMLIDFGIARWVSHKEEKGVTAVGTMGYAPPELFSGNVEPRSDIYSLGSTMFHLLTGADPQSNPLLIFDFNKHPKPRQINSQLSDQMEQILMRAVEYNSAQRFSSAAEMRDELIRHMENLKKGTVTFGVVNTSAGSPINANVPVFCGFCGQKIVATDMFCPFCGAQQPLAAQSKRLVQQPTYSAPKLLPRLVIFGTSDLESTDFVLEKDSNLLGRRDPMSNIFPEVDLSKFDPQTKISRKHARIWREGDVYMLEDLGSSNGTVLTSTINGSIRLLPRQPQVLTHGDKVRLGDTTLRFTIG